MMISRVLRFCSINDKIRAYSAFPSRDVRSGLPCVGVDCKPAAGEIGHHDTLATGFESYFKFGYNGSHSWRHLQIFNIIEPPYLLRTRLSKAGKTPTRRFSQSFVVWWIERRQQTSVQPVFDLQTGHLGEVL